MWQSFTVIGRGISEITRWKKKKHHEHFIGPPVTPYGRPNNVRSNWGSVPRFRVQKNSWSWGWEFVTFCDLIITRRELTRVTHHDVDQFYPWPTDPPSSDLRIELINVCQTDEFVHVFIACRRNQQTVWVATDRFVKNLNGERWMLVGRGVKAFTGQI